VRPKAIGRRGAKTSRARGNIKKAEKSLVFQGFLASDKGMHQNSSPSPTVRPLKAATTAQFVFVDALLSMDSSPNIAQIT
jgi:hypothetical protein